MNRASDFAYAQARLQARHGARPTPATWRRLQGIRDLAHFLQVAQRSEWRPWVLQFDVHTPAHVLERQLREQLRRYILEVARWHPPPWRPAIAWTTRLIDLPALQHLLAGQPAWPWMHDDPAIQSFAQASGEARLEARLQASDWAPLLSSWRRDESLLETWLWRWRRLWPEAAYRQIQPLESLIQLLREHLAAQPERAPEQPVGEPAGVALAERLSRLFRRHLHQPVVAFVHLSLVGLDLERLRGALLARKLFTERPQEPAA